MSLIGVARYIVFSGIFVISLFLGLRMLFAHDMRRDAWRSTVKRYIYISRPRFKLWTIIFGWLLLFIALFVAWNQIDQILTQ